MFPRFTLQKMLNRAKGELQCDSNCFLCHSGLAQCSYLMDKIVGEHRIMNLLSTWGTFRLGISSVALPCCAPPSCYFIVDVICACTLAEMCWIATRAIVAGVKNEKCCPVAGRQEISDTMRQERPTSSLGAYLKGSISSLGYGRSPVPAVAVRSEAWGLINLIVETLNILVGQHGRVYIDCSHRLKSTFQFWLDALGCRNNSGRRCVQYSTGGPCYG